MVKLAILKAWIPNGIVMIRTHMMIPARHQRIVAQKPAKTSQMMLRRIRSIVGPEPAGPYSASSSCWGKAIPREETDLDVKEAVEAARESMTVRRVYGEPYERNGVTVIPAASVQGGAGGGSGEAPDGKTGGGGGFGLRPGQSRPT